MARLFFCFVALLLALPAGAQTQLEVFELSHRTAEEIIPIVRPQLEPETRLSGDGFRLIVRGAAAEVAAVRSLLRELDRPARNLRISVRSEASAGGTRQGGSLGQRGVRVYGSESARDDRREQSVLALEGRPARISAGTAIPVRVDEVLLAEQGIAVRSGTEFLLLESGFYATARVIGERVEIDIATDQAHLPGGERLETQTVVTSLSGALGEWLPLGETGSAGRHDARGVIYRSESARERSSRLWLRVSTVD